MANRTKTNDGTCDATGCDEPTPWDMVAIVFAGDWFCSPDCARAALNEMTAAPDSITLHDPQFAVAREEVSAASDETDVDLQWPVVDETDALSVLDDIESMYPSDFRVVVNE